MVRGLQDDEYAVDMQQHLDDGCQVCLRDRDIWLGLVNTAKTDDLYEPPKEIITRVKQFASKRAVKIHPTLSFCGQRFEGVGVVALFLTIWKITDMARLFARTGTGSRLW
jgi:hypothetical protein